MKNEGLKLSPDIIVLGITLSNDFDDINTNELYLNAAGEPYKAESKVHYIDEQKEQIKEKIKTLKYPLRILRDGQGFLCEDGVCKFVGEGEEVKLE